MSSSGVGASPQAAEASTKTAPPVRKVRRRPSRSAQRPIGTRAAANTIVYALSTHESVGREVVAKSRRRSGKAMFTIVTSRKLMKTATAVTARTRHARGETTGPA